MWGELENALSLAYREGLKNGFWFGIAAGFVLTSAAFFFGKVLL
jgi:hypothetical protein